MTTNTHTLQIEEILELLPHRFPFLLVDRVLDFEEGRFLRAVKNVSVNEPFFQGHFPGKPIFPGVLILEAMAQVSQHLLTPAYMDVSLKGKFVRDEESEDMIELILATRSYDLGSIFQWGSSFSIFSGSNKNKIGTFASQVEKSAKSLTNAVQKYIDQLESAE